MDARWHPPGGGAPYAPHFSPYGPSSFGPAGGARAPPAPPARAPPGRDAPRTTAELPPCFRGLFAFRYFNSMQSEVLDAAWGADESLAVAAPTGSGKTVVFELAVCRMLDRAGCVDASGRFVRRAAGAVKAVYVAPMRAIVQERLADWTERFAALGLNCVEMTGDTAVASWSELVDADIILTTPEKFDAVTRRNKDRGSMAFFADVALFMIDEVHILGDERGPALEAVVSRLKLLSRLPALAASPLGRLRFVAVSATIPNVADVGAWIGAPRGFAPSFGDEYRACALDVKVHGYNPSKSDFLFERNLKNYLYTILLQYGDGRPSLVFCASRREAEDSAAKVCEGVPRGAGAPGGPPHPFVRSAAAAAALAAAAQNVESPRLAACLPAGVAFHSAALSSADRAAVESLFRQGRLLVLCTTSTLASGVNLPARMVVIKGTRMYDKGQYREYPRAAILQMIGRAGRPQFDERGLGVIMTERSRCAAYAQLAGGGEAVESRLAGALAEHLAAEVVARTVCDISQAVAWLKASFLWTRMASTPGAYGLPAGAPVAALEREAKALLLRTCAALADAQAIRVEDDGFGLAPLPAGVEMTRYYVRFGTLQQLQAAPRHAALPDVLLLLTSAEEYGWIKLRRDEKALMKTLNGTVRFPLLDERGKPMKVFTTGAQKLFLLVQDALSDAPCEAVAKTHSLRTEVDDVFRNGVRIARCIAETYLACGRLSGAAHALTLARAAELRLWDASQLICRQFAGIGKVHAGALAAAGYTSLEAVEAAEPRRLEAVTGRAYPFGSTLHTAAARAPRVELSLQPVGDGSGVPKRGDAIEFVVRARSAPHPNAAAAAAAAGRPAPGVLICGTRHDDALLHWQRCGVSPAEGWAMSARFSVAVPAEGPMQVVVGLIFEGVCGRDVTKHWSWTPPGGGAAAAGAGAGPRRAPLPLQPPQATPRKRTAPSAADADEPAAKRPPVMRAAFSYVAAKGAALAAPHELLSGAGAATQQRKARVVRAPLLPDEEGDDDGAGADDAPLPLGLQPRAPVARHPSPPQPAAPPALPATQAVSRSAAVVPQPPAAVSTVTTPAPQEDLGDVFAGLF